MNVEQWGVHARVSRNVHGAGICHLFVDDVEKHPPSSHDRCISTNTTVVTVLLAHLNMLSARGRCSITSSFPRSSRSLLTCIFCLRNTSSENAADLSAAKRPGASLEISSQVIATLADELKQQNMSAFLSGD